MVQRYGAGGLECALVASGGGGGGARDGGGGGGLDGELPGARVDRRCGRAGRSDAGGEAGDSGEAALCAFPAKAGRAWQGGAAAAFGGGGGGGYFGGGGGGTSPGLAGGGGGGSCFVDVGGAADFVVLQAEGRQPGGVATKQPPLACGVGDWDYVGGFAGAGGRAHGTLLHAGCHGAVRIVRPGFYDENPSKLQLGAPDVDALGFDVANPEPADDGVLGSSADADSCVR
ncbi:hypothetical protein M885DRAFT_273338 [Pelagophyceae sp. CCMP2097]|nr:hypothetical protein M885DRAFT_273338 [Pelagophyceae sp. CCMP2097]